jgi:hypothetical protein
MKIEEATAFVGVLSGGHLLSGAKRGRRQRGWAKTSSAARRKWLCLVAGDGQAAEIVSPLGAWLGIVGNKTSLLSDRPVAQLGDCASGLSGIAFAAFEMKCAAISHLPSSKVQRQPPKLDRGLT